jgi:hypothetical protein
MTKAHNALIGQKFIQALLDAGIIKIEDLAHRVVIDVRADHVVALYVERYGDERLLTVAQTLEGVAITWAPK